MALRNVLILRKPHSGCLEGRTVLLQPTGFSQPPDALVTAALRGRLGE
jgi:hypothetical protein